MKSTLFDISRVLLTDRERTHSKSIAYPSCIPGVPHSYHIHISPGHHLHFSRTKSTVLMAPFCTFCTPVLLNRRLRSTFGFSRNRTLVWFIYDRSHTASWWWMTQTCLFISSLQFTHNRSHGFNESHCIIFELQNDRQNGTDIASVNPNKTQAF